MGFNDKIFMQTVNLDLEICEYVHVSRDDLLKYLGKHAIASYKCFKKSGVVQVHRDACTTLILNTYMCFELCVECTV